MISISAHPHSKFQRLIELFDTKQFIALESQARSHLEQHPDSGLVWKILGKALHHLDKEDLQVLQNAASLLPDDHEVYYDLARFNYTHQDYHQALNSAIRSIQIKETPANRRAFVSCVKYLDSKIFNNGTGIDYIYVTLIRALAESWGSLDDLAKAGSTLIRLDHEMQVCLNLMIKQWPSQLTYQDIFSQVKFEKVAGNRLLLALMNVTPIADIALERLLTPCRQMLLDTALQWDSTCTEDESILDFYSALAAQCFINEYVFAQSSSESEKISELSEMLTYALENGIHIPSIWPLALASYIPLYSLTSSALLIERQWPGAVETILTQQVIEPAQEFRERTDILKITDIEDRVSKLVQEMYEENPYPRWVRMEHPEQAMTIDAKLQQLFPGVPFRPLGDIPKPNILIAGCGTGRQSIAEAEKFSGAKILAVDLSMSSLSYAKRKTRELGITSIEYAQADIMKLFTLKRRFDVIESCGVLHHLADPWAGWRVLLGLLRHGGFMRISLYSELGRSDIVRAREYIANQGYGSGIDELRRCRQDMMVITNDPALARVSRYSSFYSTSNCRDLIFHVQEHRMKLPEIEAFLIQNQLAFLGFEINPDVRFAYKQRFPEDSNATNLGKWRLYETEHPLTFSNMYNFWVQKSSED